MARHAMRGQGMPPVREPYSEAVREHALRVIDAELARGDPGYLGPDGQSWIDYLLELRLDEQRQT